MIGGEQTNLKVYLEANDIPDKCYHCPFVNSEDACILQDDDANFNADSWDDLQRGCPLIALPDHEQAVPLTSEQLHEKDGDPIWLKDGTCYLVNNNYLTPYGQRVPCGVDMWGQGTSLSLISECGAYCHKTAKRVIEND